MYKKVSIDEELSLLSFTSAKIAAAKNTHGCKHKMFEMYEKKTVYCVKKKDLAVPPSFQKVQQNKENVAHLAVA